MNNKPLVQLINDPHQWVITPEKLVRTYDLAKTEWGLFKVWRKRWIHMAGIWHKEMLESILREERKGQKGARAKVGDLVLIEDKNEKRCIWKKAKILRILPSHDDIERNCELEIVGEKKHGNEKTLMIRALRSLIVLS